ncbi:MAG: hypothetical protein H7222_09625 [Methylotenera sp.]|nr:hypothetical protein [Oligoflexia bacterium]
MTHVPFFALTAVLLVFTSSCGFDHSKSESVNAGDNPGTAARWSEISGDFVCPLRDSSACGIQGVFTIRSTGDYSLRLQGQRQGQDQAQVLGSVSGSERSQLLAQYNDFVSNDLPSSII